LVDEPLKAEETSRVDEAAATMQPAVPESEAVARSPARLLLKAGAIALVIALLALLAWATLAAGKGNSLVAQIAAGDAPPAPEFELEVIWTRTDTWPGDLRSTIADGRLSLNELRGRPVVLNFWASWCIPCRDEAPILNTSARSHRDGVVFVGIDVQDLRGDALAFLREFDVPYVSVRDRDDSTYRAYGLSGVPETYYLDADGRIVAHTPGVISRSSLEAGIQQAIEGRARS
jgi:cytochrome c biogenesis protein CcmG/thiol:disulfide interchange protein DsbE